jgi:hypothetical protein
VSPLAGVAYDLSSGAHDLHRWVDSPVDEPVARFVSAYDELGPDEARQARAALTMDDLYTLFAFARRSALASLRGRDEPSLRAGLAAVSAVDLQRVDWRDARTVGELVAWAMATAGLDHGAEFRRVAPRMDDATRKALRPIAERPAADLSPGRWRYVETPAGAALATDYFGRFEPSVDLVGIAMALQDVLEADVYRVDGIAVGGQLPPVWLTAGDKRALERAVNAVRACVSVDAKLDPSATSTAEDQQFVAFIAEAAGLGDAAMLASAAVSTESHEALGMSQGPVCCVLVANSIMVGVPAFEEPGALHRFAVPVESALKAAV